jgi:hypothetical protein
MLSYEQLQTACYCRDGEFICERCWTCDTIEEEREAAVSRYGADEYAGDDGLTCDACGAEIVAPTPVCEHCAAYEWDAHKPACPTLACCLHHGTGGRADAACGDDVVQDDDRQLGLYNPAPIRVPVAAVEEPTVTPEDIAVEAGIESKRWSDYNRKFNDLLLRGLEATR